MARPLRIERAGAWHHVMSRANGGDLLFRDDLDRRRFLELVSELPERFPLELHAFVLMAGNRQRCGEAGRLPGPSGERW